jgi:hypothetical protein
MDLKDCLAPVCDEDDGVAGEATQQAQLTPTILKMADYLYFSLRHLTYILFE